MKVIAMKITEHVLDVNLKRQLRETHKGLMREYEDYSVEYAGYYTVGRRFFAIWHIKLPCNAHVDEVKYTEDDEKLIKQLLDEMGDDDVVSRQSIDRIGKEKVEAFLKEHPEIKYTKLAGGHKKFDKKQLEKIVEV